MSFKNTEVQPELFLSLKKNKGPAKFGSRWFSGDLNAEITVSCDTLIVIIIAVVMLNLLMYVFGIEQGKHMASLPQERVPRRITQPAKIIEIAKEMPVPAAAQSTPVPEVGRSALDTEPMLSREEATAIAAGYVVQLITYVKDTTAQREVDRLRAAGTKSFFLKKGNYYVVYAGIFPTRELAAASQKTLRKEYSDCFIKFQSQET